jgi:4-amino-4-deoxy-L-arabinose transferase-like glycosyltransferase
MTAGVWCLYFFLRGLNERPRYYLLSGLIGSYVMFAKSMFGALPAAVIFFYLLVSRRWRAFLTWQLWAALLLYVAPYVIWCLVEYQRFGYTFLDGHFIKLMFNMGTQRSPNDHVWDYGIVLLKYFPIFLPFMLAGIWIAFREKAGNRPAYVFALTFFLVEFILLSVQSTTKTWYFISAFPSCAGLAAIGMDRALRRYTLESIGRFSAGLALVIYLVIQMTPISLGAPRAVDIRRLAPFVRAAGEQGFALKAYETDYYGLNSALMFYSDFAAEPINAADLGPTLTANPKVAIVFAASDWDKLSPTHQNLTVIRRSDELVLVSNAPLNQERIYFQ